MSRRRGGSGRIAGLVRLAGAVALIALPTAAWSSLAGADTSLVGYNAGTLAVGTQFAFNVPGVVPLPNENLIEEDVPFARTNVGGGPVVDALAAPYYPGDIAADLGSLLAEFGAPPLPLNDPLLAESKYPTSPGFPAHKTFGLAPSAATATLPSIFSSTADSSGTGGASTGTVSDISLASVSALTSVTNAVTKALGVPSAAASPVDVGNISASNSVVIGASSITATSTTQIGSIGVAGLIDIAGLDLDGVRHLGWHDRDTQSHAAPRSGHGGRPGGLHRRHRSAHRDHRLGILGRDHAATTAEVRRCHPGPGRHLHPRPGSPTDHDRARRQG